MNKITALALAAGFSLFLHQGAYAADAVPADAPPPPPAGDDQHAGGPPPPPPEMGGPGGPRGDAGPGGPGGPGGGPDGHGPERFEKADTNHDGFLTKDEMLNMQKERLDKMFAESDTNHDGKLSKEELENGFKAMREKMRAHFGQAPQDRPKQ